MPAQDLPPSGEPWPTEIRLSKDRKTLTIGFDTGESFALAAGEPQLPHAARNERAA
jgi:hypothetical protein